MFLLVVCVEPVSATIHVPAVTKDGDQGSVAEVDVVISEGTGEVTVEGTDGTEIGDTLRGSAYLAAFVASDMTDIDMSKYDFVYRVEINSEKIDGPSAGAAMAVETVAEIEGWETDDTVITGMVNPDGSIGPVGGVESKLNVSASEGYDRLVVPTGQTRIKDIERGPRGSRITEKTNLTKIGNQRGIEVVEVGSVAEAVEVVTGKKVSSDKNKVNMNASVRSESFTRRMRGLASNLRNSSYALLEESRERGINTTQAENEIERGESYFDNESYYSSTSAFFQSMITMRSAIFERKIENEGLDAVKQEVRNEIDTSKEYLESRRETTALTGLQASESRITKAEARLEGVGSLDSTEVDVAANRLGFAYERARTARYWVNVTQQPESETRDYPRIKTVAKSHLDRTERVWDYFQVMFDLPDNFRPNSLTTARTNYEKGYYYGSMIDSLSAFGVLSARLQSFDVNPNITREYKTSKREARAEILDAQRKGIDSTLPVSLYLFSQNSLEDERMKFEVYEQAKLIAKYNAQIKEPPSKTPAGLERVTDPVVNGESESLIRPGTPLAVAALVLVGLLASVLVRRLKPKH
ncbi:MAG: S16 family serine protease [Halobacteria archaeon]|nr:S16 family serine protease [Halobacteria archaeon]